MALYLNGRVTFSRLCSSLVGVYQILMDFVDVSGARREADPEKVG